MQAYSRGLGLDFPRENYKITMFAILQKGVLSCPAVICAVAATSTSMDCLKCQEPLNSLNSGIAQVISQIVLGTLTMKYQGRVESEMDWELLLPIHLATWLPGPC